MRKYCYELLFVSSLSFKVDKCLSKTCSVPVKALLNVWVRYNHHMCSKSHVCWLRTGTLSSSMNLWSCSFGERSVNVSRKCCPGMKWLDVCAEFCVAVDIAKVEGDLKLFLCEADWIHLSHNQLGTLGLKEKTQEVHKFDAFSHGVVMLLLWRERTVSTSVLFEKVLRKREFGGLSPI